MPEGFESLITNLDITRGNQEIEKPSQARHVEQVEQFISLEILKWAKFEKEIHAEVSHESLSQNIVVSHRNQTLLNNITIKLATDRPQENIRFLVLKIYLNFFTMLSNMYKSVFLDVCSQSK
jgi:hypothetical protein